MEYLHSKQTLPVGARTRLGRNRNGRMTSTAGAGPSRLGRRCTIPFERKAFPLS